MRTPTKYLTAFWVSLISLTALFILLIIVGYGLLLLLSVLIFCVVVIGVCVMLIAHDVSVSIWKYGEEREEKGKQT